MSASQPVGADDTTVRDPEGSPGGALSAVRSFLLAVAPSALVLAMSAGQNTAPGGPWPVVVLLAQALPLLFLRHAPRLVLVVVAGVTTAQLALGLPASNGLAAQAVAVAVVVARTSWPVSVLAPVLVLAASAVGAAVGGVPAGASFLLVTAASLVLAWHLGDAAGRRAEVRCAMEQALSRQAQHQRLQAHVLALSERVRIARELHRLAGEALDAVVVQAGAARARLVAGADPGDVVAGIESPAREALAELDRFLGLLRREVVGTAGDERMPREGADAVPVPEGRGQPWLEARAPGLTLVGTALGVGLLAAVDLAALPSSGLVPRWWSVALPGVVAGLLLLRRRSPDAVTAVLVVLLGAHLAAGVAVESALLAVPVAVHGVAVVRDRRRATTTAVVAVAVLACATASVEPAGGVRALGVLGVLCAVAVYAGGAVQAARRHNAGLSQRLLEAGQAEQLQRQAVVADERARAARDLHDSLGHTLSLIIVQAGAARLAAAPGTPRALARAEEVLGAVEGSARSALAALDESLADVSRAAPVPGPVLPAAGDVPAVVEAVRHAGTPVTLRMEPIEDLPRSVQATVFRVVQEALTNVVKHAPGAAATVEVRRGKDVVEVVVRNGAGAGGTPGLPSGGRGLPGMAERLAMFDGTLRTSPDGRGGYVVHATMRVPRPARQVAGRDPAPREPVPAPVPGRRGDEERS